VLRWKIEIAKMTCCWIRDRLPGKTEGVSMAGGAWPIKRERKRIIWTVAPFMIVPLTVACSKMARNGRLTANGSKVLES